MIPFRIVNGFISRIEMPLPDLVQPARAFLQLSLPRGAREREQLFSHPSQG